MPGFDGTGPEGRGPMTGGGMGNCAPGDPSTRRGLLGLGFRRGFGRRGWAGRGLGAGRGFGVRGWRNR